jgi:hypothetical protein
MRPFLAFAAVLALTGITSPALSADVRDYVCTVEQKAGIGAVHLEGAGAPEAFIATETPTRFAMRITGEGQHFTAIETPYSGADRDRYEWHTSNTVLHSAYESDDGQDFVAVEDRAFLRVTAMTDGSLRFYHAGFEYPGGEDTNLSVRWGLCARS